MSVLRPRHLAQVVTKQTLSKYLLGERVNKPLTHTLCFSCHLVLYPASQSPLYRPVSSSLDLYIIPFKLPSSGVKPQPLSKELTRTNQNVSGATLGPPPRSFPALLGQASSLLLFVLPLISLKIVTCDFYQPLSLSWPCIQDAPRFTTCAHLALGSCSVVVTKSCIFKKFPTLCVTADHGDG